MTHLLPVHQVAAVEDGYPRIVTEGGGHQEIVALAIGAYAGVGVPAGQDGVVEGVLLGEWVMGVAGIGS